MKLSAIVFILIVAVRLVAAEVRLDDTLEQVIAAKGQPAGQMKTSRSQVLQYPDETIKIAAGRVVAITPVVARRAPLTPAVTTPPAGPVAPEVVFAPAGFEAKLSSVVTWQVAPPPQGVIVEYSRVFESDGRQIVIILDRNRENESAADFLAGWKRSLLKKDVKITAESTRMIGQANANVIDAALVSRAGNRYFRCVILVTKQYLYAINVTSSQQPVADDNVLTAFINSIRIKSPAP